TPPSGRRTRTARRPSRLSGAAGPAPTWARAGYWDGCWPCGCALLPFPENTRGRGCLHASTRQPHLAAHDPPADRAARAGNGARRHPRPGRATERGTYHRLRRLRPDGELAPRGQSGTRDGAVVAAASRGPSHGADRRGHRDGGRSLGQEVRATDALTRD